MQVHLGTLKVLSPDGPPIEINMGADDSLLGYPNGIREALGAYVEVVIEEMNRRFYSSLGSGAWPPAGGENGKSTAT